jgi:phospholipase C
MNGFDKEGVECGQTGEPRCPIKHPQYAYVPHAETKPYFQIAAQYVLADRMFVSNLDASSYVSHQYIIAAQASSAVNIPEGGPWGCSGMALVATLTQARAIGPSISACLDNQTLGDELDAAGISWKYFTASLDGDGAFWSAYQAIEHIYQGPDWDKDVISPQTRFFDYVRKGRLPAVSWVTPTCENSDHAACNSATGPKWVASLVNAVGESRYWKSTAIFIFWDDPGGWYDHVPPKKLDYDGLGYRVPLLVVSPYAKKGYVSHVNYEHGSLLRFVEDRFGLATLSASDARATSPEADCFDFNQPPRKFVPIPSSMTARDFEREPLDRRIVDSQ